MISLCATSSIKQRLTFTMDRSSPTDMDSSFEPMQRARSNTWPLPKPENFEEKLTATTVAIKCEQEEILGIDCSPNLDNISASSVLLPPGSNIQSPVNQLKKNSSRRNAWGNLSYADLITQAISSSPDNRLTLSQIYEWMVHNVPYFKDKGDNNSSAGWKNSIRHNLSLHNRFIRVQNEGTGKSSWWMLNPDAKPGKSVRRRATSMETSKFEKRRGRVKKKVEALRNSLQASGSPSSSIIETLDLFPDSPLHGFQLSPDCRTRASSNASSSSRLSPILSLDPDWTLNCNSYIQPDQLAGNLEQVMRINQADQPLLYGIATSSSLPYSSQHQSPNVSLSSFSQQMSFERVAVNTAQQVPDMNCSIHQLQPCNCYFNTDAVTPNTENGSTTSSPGESRFLDCVNPNLLDDLNINIENIDGDFECNVDEVIRHELSIGGSLDFNFTGNTTQSSSSPSDEQRQTSTTNHDQQLPFKDQSWVH